MPGVTLGDYCVVAANSYVNKSFASFSIIGGNPARYQDIYRGRKEKMIGE